jgi:hypothetical protein
MGWDTLNAERARRPSVQWQAARLFLNKCRGCTTSHQVRPSSLCHGPQAAGLRLSGKWRARPTHVSAPDPCTHQGPSRSGTLLEFGPTRRLRTCMYIGVRCPSVGIRTYWVWCLSLPRGALWPAHLVGSGTVLRVARRRRMGAVSSCCRRGYPCFRVPTVAPGPASGEDASLQVGPESDWRLDRCFRAHVAAITTGPPMTMPTVVPIPTAD